MAEIEKSLKNPTWKLNNWNVDISLDMLQIKDSLDIQFLKESGFFEELDFKKWDTIFNEWDIDNNLYIIVSWDISIEKSLHNNNNNNNETKVLASIWKFGIFWEGSLNNNNPKEVKVVASNNVKILRINAKEWMEKFLLKFPIKWFNLLKYIIDLTNRRLLESNALITSTYEINKAISWIDKIDNKTIFSLIDKFREIVWCDYIIYLENNAVMENYLTIVYDTRNNWRMTDYIVEIKPGIDISSKLKNIEELKIKWNNLFVKLNIWDINIWYFVLWKKDKDFIENDKKIIFSISNSLSWIIRQQRLNKDERNIDFMLE